MPIKENHETITQLDETGFDPETLERLKRDGIYATEIAATPDSGHEGLQNVCKDFNLVSLRPDLYTNFSLEDQPLESWQDDKNIVYVALVPGWLSYKRDWILEGESGGCLLAEIFSEIRERLGEDVKIVAYGLPTIGFEGAELLNEDNLDNTQFSGKRYAEFIKANCNALNIPKKKTVRIGHSFGGRSLLVGTNEGEADIAINPSVELPEEKEGVSWLDKVKTGGKLLRTAFGAPLNVSQKELFATLGKLINIGRTARKIPGARILENELVERLVTEFLGLGEHPTPEQIEMKERYIEQLEKHELVAIAIAENIAKQEKIEGLQAVRILVANQDSLVSTQTLMKFVRDYFDSLFNKIKEKLNAQQWKALQNIPKTFLYEQLFRQTKGGHCNLFTDRETQKTVAESVAEAAYLQRLRNPETVKQILNDLTTAGQKLVTYGSSGWEGQTEGTPEQEASHYQSLYCLHKLEKLFASFPDKLEDVKNLPPETIAEIWRNLTISDFDEEGKRLPEDDLLLRASNNLFGDPKYGELIYIMRSSLFGLPLTDDQIIQIGKQMGKDFSGYAPQEALSSALKFLLADGIMSIIDARDDIYNERNHKNYAKLLDLAKNIKPFSQMIENMESTPFTDATYQEKLLIALEEILQQD